MKPDFKTIGLRLKMLRKALGKTQDSIANDLQVNDKVINRIEKSTGGTIHNFINMIYYYNQFFDLNNLFSEDFEVIELTTKVNINSQSAERLKIIQEEISKVIYSLEKPS